MLSIAASGKTILFVSHQMNTIRQLCDRVVVLREGEVIFDDFLEAVDARYECMKNNWKVPYLYEEEQKEIQLDNEIIFDEVKQILYVPLLIEFPLL